MGEQLYGLTARTAGQLRQILADGGAVGGRASKGTEARGVTWVQVTGAAEGDGWYPGVVSLPADDGWEDLDAEVRVAPGAAAALVVGVRYLCARTGDRGDGMPRFRATAGGGGGEAAETPDCGLPFMGRDELDCFEARVPALGVGLCANVTATSDPLALSWDSGAEAYLSDSVFGTAGGDTGVALGRLTNQEPTLTLVIDGGGTVPGRFSACLDGGWRRYAFYSTALCNEGWVTGCSGCVTAAKRFKFTAVGGTDAAAVLNGFWVVPYSTGCTWTGPKVSGENPTNHPAAILTLPTELRLYPAGTSSVGAVALYSLSGDPCCGPLTATLVGSAGISGTIPPTIQIEAVGPCRAGDCAGNYLFVDVRCAACLVPTVCCATGRFPRNMCVAIRPYETSTGGACPGGYEIKTRDLAYNAAASATYGKGIWHTAVIPASPMWGNAPEAAGEGFPVEVVGWVFVVYCDGTNMRAGLWALVDPAYSSGTSDPVVNAIFGAGTYRAVTPTVILLGAGADCGDAGALAFDGFPLWGGSHPFHPTGSAFSYPCHSSSGEGWLRFTLGKGSCGGGDVTGMMVGALAVDHVAPTSAAAPDLVQLQTRTPCRHQGDVVEPCAAGDPLRHVRECDLFGRCTLAAPGKGHRTCRGCDRYEPDPALLAAAE